MAYRVIVVGNDQEELNIITNTLKKSPDFYFAASYKNANSAISQSRMFNPDLFLIDVDDVESLNMIPAFLDIFPNADVLGLVSKWTSDIAKEIQKFGALGCILKPFTAIDVINVLDIYKKRGRRKISRIISFFSPKGRAGRTTMASILALSLAAKSGERVALIDADLQFGDLPIFFDIEPEQTIIEATQDVNVLTPLTLEPYFYNIKKNLYLLSSSERPEYAELVDVKSLIDVVKLSCNIFRYVLIDLPLGFNPLSVGMTELADTVFVMAMVNNGFEIQHMKRALEFFYFNSDENHKRIYPVFTRVEPCTEREKSKIEEMLTYPVSDIIPNEYEMISLANGGRIARGLPTDSLFINNIDNIADDIINEKR